MHAMSDILPKDPGTAIRIASQRMERHLIAIRRTHILNAGWRSSEPGYIVSAEPTPLDLRRRTGIGNTGSPG
jgi:hypothetical protein